MLTGRISVKRILGYILFIFLAWMCLIMLVLNKRYNIETMIRTNSHRTSYSDKTKEVTCNIPRLSLKTDENAFTIKQLPPLKCGGKSLMNIHFNGSLVLNETVLYGWKIVQCRYYNIVAELDDQFSISDYPVVKNSPPFTLSKFNHDFVKMNCTLKKPGGSVQHIEQKFAQIVEKQDVIKQTKEIKPLATSLQMNVLILVLDGMSQLCYQRKLPKTFSYLKDTLGAVILDRYNIVGDGTANNMIPILTGRHLKDFPNVRKGSNNSEKFDSVPLIWKKFKHSGYVTMFSQDLPDGGLFTFSLNGFHKPPVDHYTRPFFLSIAQHPKNRYCDGSKPIYQHQLQYTLDFIQKYENIPKFATMFCDHLSHNNYNPSQYIDHDLMQGIKMLYERKILDNTLLIVMGDHGQRYGEIRKTFQGKLEERLPMMSLTFPPYFRKKYHKYYRNLQTNANRLTTPFDLHETFKDMLDVSRFETPVKHTARGISLLREIPANRTCKSAKIGMHFCTCMEFLKMNNKHNHIIYAADKLLATINKMLANHSDKCMKLKLDEILDARLIIPQETFLDRGKHVPDLDIGNLLSNAVEESDGTKLDNFMFQITIATSPNEGRFEGTVLYTTETSKYRVIPEISRTNHYGGDSICIAETNPELLKFCYCIEKWKK